MLVMLTNITSYSHKENLDWLKKKNGKTKTYEIMSDVDLTCFLKWTFLVNQWFNSLILVTSKCPWTWNPEPCRQVHKNFQDFVPSLLVSNADYTIYIGKWFCIIHVAHVNHTHYWSWWLNIYIERNLNPPSERQNTFKTESGRNLMLKCSFIWLLWWCCSV